MEITDTRCFYSNSVFCMKVPRIIVRIRLLPAYSEQQVPGSPAEHTEEEEND